MWPLLRQERDILGRSALALGSLFLLAIAGAAVALRAGVHVQVVQEVMTWTAVPWFGVSRLVCTEWCWQRMHKRAEREDRLFLEMRQAPLEKATFRR